MKEQILILALTGFAGSLLAAESGPKEEVVAAAKKLGEKANYSWHTTVVVPESAQFKLGEILGEGWPAIQIRVQGDRLNEFQRQRY